MINFIFEFIWIILSVLLISYGILLYLVRRLSVKLRNLPSYKVWHIAYFPEKIELRGNSKENVSFNLEAKRLNF